MEEIENYELIKLDLILGTIRFNQTNCINAEGIRKELQADTGRIGYRHDPLFTDINLYLQILIDDKFVDIDTSANPLSVKINLKGILHLKGNGYIGQFNRRHAESIRLEAVESSAKANRTFQTWLTFFVALGTLIAAWYYITELYKFYHSCCSCHH